jgi:hypothetical protein
MELKTSRSRSRHWMRRGLLAIGCAALVVPCEGALLAQQQTKTPTPAPAAAAAAEPDAPKLPPEQLDSLVAPIALYPDKLLAQTLVASTYPLEIIQLQQWLAKNPTLKDKALADAVAKQPWDPSIQTMAATPEVVKRLADDVQWTTDLGNAFLAQQSDVMDAVQRMRAKAKGKGALESNEQQKVETKVIEEKTVIVVESANPEVIYVPSYSPTVVYGAPYYPYPPIYYPPYPPGAAFVSFGIGMMWGAAIWGGSCCGCGWGGNNVNINVNNNFNRNNINNGNIGRGSGSGNNWSHNPQHRGGAPYSNKATASKYGGSTRGGTGRGASPSTQQARSGQGAGAGNRAASPSASNRTAGGAKAGGAGPSAASRGGSSSWSGAGGDKVGNRSIPKSTGGNSGFSGGSRGYSGSSARASSSRGASSMGSRGGGSRGGGGGRRR